MLLVPKWLNQSAFLLIQSMILKVTSSDLCSSQTLYLKNLSAKAKEEDLVALFNRFQREDGPKIVFRLMTGRMKGQAFVTFEGKLCKK